jgi:hypothetical protein
MANPPEEEERVGTTHVGLVERVDWLLSMIGEYLDAPMPETE